MYLPVLDTVITEMSLSWPYKTQLNHASSKNANLFSQKGLNREASSKACPFKPSLIEEIWGILLLHLVHELTVRTYPEELLSSGDDVSDDDGGAERVDDVLVVRVQDETVGNLAYKTINDDS